MQNRFLLQVAFHLSSLIFWKAQDVIGYGHSCLRWSTAEDGQMRVTFLQEDTTGVRSLYLTLWSDTRLSACEVNTDPFVTERYRALCDSSSTQQGEEVAQRFNISTVLAPGALCANIAFSAPKYGRRFKRNGTEGKARKKRAWTLPGTLWCGKGSKAVGYEQLGMFENADRCCREHDHCPHIIHAFTVNYGVFNPNFYVVSHCDCDQRFRQCLLDMNDTISHMVGYSFFSILRIPCFELKQQRRCTEMYWWGTCKTAKKAPYAIFKSPLPYNTSDASRKYEENTDSNKSTSEEQHVTERKSPKSERRCSSRDPPRGDSFHRGTKGKGCKRPQKLSTLAPSQISTTSKTHTTTLSMKTGLLNPSKNSTLMTNKKRVGKKKSSRKGLLAYTTGSQVPPQVTSTTKTTQMPALHLHLPTAITAVTKAMKSHKIVPKPSRCCRSRTPVRGDPFWPHCKNCLQEVTTSHMTTVKPAITINGLPIKATTLRALQLKETTEPQTPKQDSVKRLWNTVTFSTPITTKLKRSGPLRKNGKPQKQLDSHLLQDNTSQDPMGSTIAQNTHAKKNLKQSNALHNMTDIQLLCGSLKHLDECKYKIPPLEKKYDLQNMESKTAYHCGCISRLAVQAESFKQPSVLSTLLMDFISQYCFKLPKDKKCHSRKRFYTLLFWRLH
uniref:group 3 secretory phospholipase A2-like isoform X2 n=1 Tax=Monopterus albus TaxID=43700 RepID=UPI0009B3F9E6|nr:group 3 secretory phospholipase A2-like isoform X2 [Monopterus albus]